ncbi:MAG: hypothetical protein ABI140_16585 [Jatrophihabitantaceae bacterium]
MLKKIVIAGSAAAVILGAGTAALAASGPSSSPAPSSSSSTSAGTGAKAKAAHGKRSELKRALHATWVTRDGKASTTYVTHDAIRGEVTAVSATSITVKAADNVSQTYTLNSSTKVHSRADGKGKAGTISELMSGDKVLVAGTGTSTLTATQVLDATK